MNPAKYFIFLFSLIIANLNGQNYCIPTYSQGTASGDYIDGIILKEDGLILFSNLGSGSVAGPSFSDYSDLTIELAASTSYIMEVICGYGTNSSHLSIWFDYNFDGDFNDANELLASGINDADTVDLAFTTKADLININSRIRVCLSDTPPDPCNPKTWGETEDYGADFPMFSRIEIDLGLELYDIGDFDQDNDLDLLGTGGLYHPFDSIRIGINTQSNIYDVIDPSIIGNYRYLFSTIRKPCGWIENFNNSLDIVAGPNVYANHGSNIFQKYSKIYNCAISDFASKDLDNDGILDFVISGTRFDYERFSSTFHASSDYWIPVMNLDKFNLGFSIGDIDMDGDHDILSDENLFLNTNAGVFFDSTVLISDELSGSNHLGDYDDDGDLDISSNGYIYLNNRSSFERRITGTSGSFYDFDNDGDLDLLSSSKIYINTGFLEFDTLSFESSLGGIVGDYDNDGDLDIINSQTIYRNNCIKENLAPSPPTNLQSEYNSKKVTLSWVPGSDDSTPVNGLSYNIYVGSYPSSTNIVSPSSDMESGYRRIINRGNVDQNTSWSIKGLDYGIYYWSVQAIDHSFSGSMFAEEASFTIVPFQSKLHDQGIGGLGLKLADLDNDNDIDIIAGNRIYHNEGLNSYILQNSSSTSKNETICTFDFNNDGNIDVFQSNPDSSRLYLNNGSVLTPIEHDIPPLINMYTEFCNLAQTGDIDNDGLIDILTIERTEEFSVGNLFFYKNLGDNKFSRIDLKHEANMIFCADLNNDAEIEVVVMRRSSSPLEVNIFKLSEDDSLLFVTPLDIPYASRIDLADFDNDNDLDILGSSDAVGATKPAYLFRNEGDFIFSELDIGIEKIWAGSSKFGDFDNDDDLDIAHVGMIAPDGLLYSVIYKNIDGSFSAIEEPFEPLNFGHLAWCDMDQDMDLDLITTCSDIRWYDWGQLREMTNTSSSENLIPDSLQNLMAHIDNYDIILQWDEGTIDGVLIGGLTYNIRVGTTPGGFDIVSPCSDPVTGFRRIPEIGNAQCNMGWKLKNLPLGTYYWSVQAIDHSFSGGPWADEQSFTITSVNADFEADTVCEGPATTFTDLTITSGDPLTSWNWDFGDGGTSTLQNPTHIFPGSGIYPVKLIASTASYSDTISHDVMVKPAPMATFSTDVVCQGTATTITNSSSANGSTGLTWSWDFGDGSSSTVMNPGSHGYFIAGTYTVNLNVLADNGCSDSYGGTAIVGAIPAPGITADGNTSFCTGENVTLRTTKTLDYTYTWQLDEVVQSNADSSFFVATESGPYRVAVTNPSGGCTGFSDELIVTVNTTPSSPSIEYIGSTTFCEGLGVTLSVSDIAGYTYTWKREDGGAVGYDHPEYLAISSGEYSVHIVDANDCEATSVSAIAVTVIDTPNIAFIERIGSESFCEGGSATLSVGTDPAWDYQWKQSSDLVPGGTSNSLIVTESGNYYVEVTDDSGAETCSSLSNTESINVVSSPESPVIFADGDTVFCEGGSVVLSTPLNSDQIKYTWRRDDANLYVDANQVEVSESGKYSLDIETIDAEECSQATSNDIFVRELSNPEKLEIFSAEGFQMCEGESLLATVDDPGGMTFRWLRDGTAIPDETGVSYSVADAGDYTLEISDANSCTTLSNPKTFEVTALPDMPQISEINDRTNICPGEKLTLRVENPLAGYSYMWWKEDSDLGINGSTFSGSLENKAYSVVAAISEAAAAQGCTTASDRVQITWKDALDKPGIVAQGPNVWYLACTNSDANIYRWYHEGDLLEEGDQYLYVADKNMGKYRVEISDDGNCFTSSDVISIPDIIIIGMEENIWENLKIYPNPTPGLFTLEMNNPVMGELVIDILNETGAMVLNIKFQKEMAHFKTEIDLSGQAPAIYLIGLLLENYQTSRKIIVE